MLAPANAPPIGPPIIETGMNTAAVAPRGPLLPFQFGNILLAYELALPLAAIAGAIGALWLTGADGGALGALLQIISEPMDATEAFMSIGPPLGGVALGHLVGLAGAVVLLGQYGLAVPLEEGTKVFILWNVAVAAGAVGGTVLAASLPQR